MTETEFWQSWNTPFSSKEAVVKAEISRGMAAELLKDIETEIDRAILEWEEKRRNR